MSEDTRLLAGEQFHENKEGRKEARIKEEEKRTERKKVERRMKGGEKSIQQKVHDQF